MSFGSNVDLESTTSDLTAGETEPKEEDQEEEHAKFKSTADQEEGSLTFAESEEETARDILALDANLKRVKWTMHYIGTCNPLPGKSIRTILAELVVEETFVLVDLTSDGSLKGEAWVMDVTMTELPSNHMYNSLDRAEAYIIHQELYFRKTKPPKLGGGTMDTRRCSPDDTVLKVSFDCSKKDIKGIIYLSPTYPALS